MSYYVNNMLGIAAETDHMPKILDAKNQPADLKEVAARNKNLKLE